MDKELYMQGGETNERRVGILKKRGNMFQDTGNC